MLSELLKKSMPVYEVYLPAKKKKINFRPMSVKEEKNLLLAQNEGKISTIALSLKQILENCFDDIGKVENLELIDVQTAFIELRAKSMGEIFSFEMTCPHTGDNVKLQCSLADFKQKINEERKNTINIADNFILVMKNPSLSYFIQKKEENDSIKDLFVECFVELHTEDNVFEKNQTSKQDIEEFFDSLTVSQYEKVINYFENIPKLELKINYTTKDKIKREVVFNGLDSFFELASVI